MSSILKCSNYIILDNQGLLLIQAKKNSGQFKVATINSNYEDFNGSQLNKKEVVLLLPTTQLFIESFFLPLQAKDKLDDILRVKFIKKIALAEDELYYSYYVDKQLYEDKLLIICFAVKKEVADNAYKMFGRKGIKLKSIVPLPLLSYIYHSQQNKSALRNVYINIFKRGDSKQKNEAVIYLDRLFSYISYTAFFADGIYMRSASLENFKKEHSRICKYLGEDLNISNFILYNAGEKIDEKGLIERPPFKEMFYSIIKGINKSEIKILNLLPQLPKEKKKKINKYRFIILIILILILTSNIISFTSYFQTKRDELAFYKGELSKLEPAITQLYELQSQIDIKNKQLTIYKNIAEKRQSYLPWIYELSKQLPLGVKINYLTFKGDKMILLDGVAPSASKIMEVLQASDIFKNLEFIGGIVINKEGEQFRIAGDLIND